MIIFEYRIKDNDMGKTNINGGVKDGKGKERKGNDSNINTSDDNINNRSIIRCL